MAAIYDEIVLSWGGEEYTIQPSYRMIQSIESQGVSIVGVSQRLIQGEPPISLVAQIVSHMLRSAGAKASPDQVYEHLMTEADSDEIAYICEAVVSAFTPRKKDQEGNAEQPRTAAKKRSSKK